MRSHGVLPRHRRNVAGQQALVFSWRCRLPCSKECDIATANVDNAVRVWDILSAKTTLILNSGSCHGVVFTPDDRRVVTARGVVKVWDAVSGQETLTLRGTKAAQAIYSVAVSPDGTKIVACTKDGKVILWDSEL